MIEEINNQIYFAKVLLNDAKDKYRELFTIYYPAIYQFKDETFERIVKDVKLLIKSVHRTIRKITKLNADDLLMQREMYPIKKELIRHHNRLCKIVRDLQNDKKNFSSVKL